VKIDLHHHLLQNRRNAMNGQPALVGAGGRSQFFAWVVNRPAVYEVAQKSSGALPCAFTPAGEGDSARSPRGALDQNSRPRADGPREFQRILEESPWVSVKKFWSGFARG